MKRKSVMLLICLSVVVGIVNARLADFCINGECFKEEKKKKEHKDEEAHDYDYWYNQSKERRPISFFDFVKSIFNMRVNNSEFYKYIEGFKFIVKTFSDLYSQKQRMSTEEETEYFNMVKGRLTKDKRGADNKERSDFNNLMKNQRPSSQAQSAETMNSTLRLLRVNESLQSPNKDNNTDIYHMKSCPTVPDMKVNLKQYYCNETQVASANYTDLLKDPNNKCEFYTNKDRICFCPVNYLNCQDQSQKLFCDIKELKVNKDTDLLKFRNTFYYEYFNKTLLDKKNSPFDFTIGLRCAYVNQTVEEGNFYLSKGRLDEFEKIHVNYPDDYKGDKVQYSEEQVRDVNTPILKYFLNYTKAVIYPEVTLTVSFSIFDLLWLLPRKVQKFELSAKESADLIAGKANFHFTIDIEKLLAKEDADPIFSNDLYPKAKKGNLLFYELLIYPSSKRFNFQFFSYRGEIIDE